MGVDEVGHLVMREQAVAGGEFDRAAAIRRIWRGRRAKLVTDMNPQRFLLPNEPRGSWTGSPVLPRPPNTPAPMLQDKRLLQRSENSSPSAPVMA